MEKLSDQNKRLISKLKKKSLKFSLQGKILRLLSVLLNN